MLKDGSYVEVTSNERPFKGYVVKVQAYNPANFGIPLPWALSGVERYDGLDLRTEVDINEDDVLGKAVICGEILTGWYKEWMLSKTDD